MAVLPRSVSIIPRRMQSYYLMFLPPERMQAWRLEKISAAGKSRCTSFLSLAQTLGTPAPRPAATGDRTAQSLVRSQKRPDRQDWQSFPSSDSRHLKSELPP